MVARGISQVPEGRRIFPRMTVRDNLEMGAYQRKDTDAVKEDMDAVFELFPVLKERMKQSGGTLSGGEQQMLAIGRALMSRPKLLMLDEPSMGLAPLMVERIFEAIGKINREGTTILLVEQNAQVALQMSLTGLCAGVGRDRPVRRLGRAAQQRPGPKGLPGRLSRIRRIPLTGNRQLPTLANTKTESTSAVGAREVSRSLLPETSDQEA